MGNSVETADQFYAGNGVMLGDPLHVQWDQSVTIVYRDSSGAERPDLSLTASTSPAVMQLFKDNYGYFPGITDTPPLELRAGYVVQNAETEYGPMGPGPINCADIQAEYVVAFKGDGSLATGAKIAGGTYQQKVDWLTKWFAPLTEPPQQPMSAAQAGAILAAAGYTSSPPTPPEIQVFKPVQQLGADFGNALKAWVSFKGGNPIELAVIPATPPTAWDDTGNDVTASLAAQGVDINALLAAMQAAV